MKQTLYLMILLLCMFHAKAQQVKCKAPNGEKITPISQIQSDITSLKNDASPLIGQWVWVEAVVTVSKQGGVLPNGQYDTQYKGYWLQEQIDDYDQSAQTSEGLFVYDKQFKVNAGDQIIIKAKVGEYNQVTQLQSVKKIIRCASNQIIKPIKISLPVKDLLIMESIEGMLVSFDSLMVSDFYGAGFGLQNYGQIVLSSKLHFVPTEHKQLSLREYETAIEDMKKDRLFLNDGSYELKPSFLPYPNSKGLSLDNPINIGSTIQYLTGVKHGYKQNHLLIPNDDVQFDVKPLPNIKKITENAKHKIALLNAKNYFNGEGANKTFPTKRGAKTKQAFLIQQSKLVSALTQVDADILALIEIENDGFDAFSAVVELTQALNKYQSEDNQYTYLRSLSSKANSDAITQVFLYRPNTVSLKGEPTWIDLNDAKNGISVRPALMQVFEIEGESLRLVLNHFKSRRGSCKGDSALAKVEGGCESVRMRSAQKITDALKSNANEAIILLGDLNAYSNESPVLWFLNNDFINSKRLLLYLNEQSYTYGFNGMLGTLDHVLVNDQAKQKIKFVFDWRINSDYPSMLAKMTDENPTMSEFAGAVANSDHDLVLIGLND
ncbi:ExeM/NucH family extracellular endonuclease [Marinicellulosiphila megalodicopiae]|uniref:ExeM/NucH family extracellular endonuclease n=1 Tax=Marinicellulosiphila megalodicopiae TaxID=2724896 RepID=UPI003BB16956